MAAWQCLQWDLFASPKAERAGQGQGKSFSPSRPWCLLLKLRNETWAAASRGSQPFHSPGWRWLSAPGSLMVMLMSCCKEETAQTGGLVCLLSKTWSLRLPRACLFLLHASVCRAVLTELSPAFSSSSYPGSLFFNNPGQGTEPEGQVTPQHRWKRAQLSWHQHFISL